MLYLSHSVNCHVYTCLMVLTLDMLTYDILTWFNTEILPSSFIVPPPTKVGYAFSFNVTANRTKFFNNKAKEMQKFIFSMTSTCFIHFVRQSSWINSLYIQQWCMSYMFVDSFRSGPGWNCISILFLHETSLQTSMTYTIAECTVNKLLMMDRGIFRNM